MSDLGGNPQAEENDSPISSPIAVSPASTFDTVGESSGASTINESASISPTSPLHSSSFDTTPSPVGKPKRKAVCRTTLQRHKRRLFEQESCESSQHLGRKKPGESRGRGSGPSHNTNSSFNNSFDDEFHQGSSTTVSDTTSNERSSFSDSSSEHDTSINNSNPSSPNSESSPCGSDDGSTANDQAESDRSGTALFNGSNVSGNDALLQVLHLYVEEKWTKSSLDKNVKLIKKLLPQPNDLPSSGKAALKRFEKLTVSYQETEYQYCKKTLQLVETEGDTCEHSEGLSKFYTFPVQDQIKHFFEHRDLASLIDEYSAELQEREDDEVFCV